MMTFYNPYIDKSELYKAWNKHYSHLSFNKRLKLVRKKVMQMKAPPNQNIKDLVFYR